MSDCWKVKDKFYWKTPLKLLLDGCEIFMEVKMNGKNMKIVINEIGDRRI